MLPHHTDRGIWFVIVIILFFLVGNFIFTQYEINQLKNNVSVSPVTTFPVSDTCGPNCQAYINTAINQAIVSPSPSASTIPTPLPKVSSAQTPKAGTQITYVPLTGGSTQNTDWVNIASSQFSFNIGDYGARSDKLPYITWDANLTATNPNDTTYARIFDVTHQIGVNGSDISISNTTSSSFSEDIVSGQLQFWQGNNTYVVQVKSLNGSTALVGSGRIKIVY